MKWNVGSKIGAGFFRAFEACGGSSCGEFVGRRG